MVKGFLKVALIAGAMVSAAPAFASEDIKPLRVEDIKPLRVEDIKPLRVEDIKPL
jgi:hypothetical protein